MLISHLLLATVMLICIYRDGDILFIALYPLQDFQMCLLRSRDLHIPILSSNGAESPGQRQWPSLAPPDPNCPFLQRIHRESYDLVTPTNI